MLRSFTISFASASARSMASSFRLTLADKLLRFQCRPLPASLASTSNILRDEPRLSPYCFMWLGHELGHTLHYLIDDVAYTHGWQFLENPGETTPTIARYGRSLSVRTLFQVPYVHLFEWWLLMRFHEGGFAGLPWQMSDDAFAVGEDVRDEIAEAFDLIHTHARLTFAGQAVVACLRELVAEADAHWRWLFVRRLHSQARRRR